MPETSADATSADAKHPHARILSDHGHLNALGYRIARGGIEALPRPLERLRSRVAEEMSEGRSGCIDFDRSITATAGVVLF